MVFFLAGLARFLTRHGRKLSIILAAVLWIVGVIQHCIIEVITELRTMLEALDISAFNNVSFAGLQYIGYCNAVFPLSETLGLLGIYLTAWVLVVIFRWVKSFMPTVAN